VVRSGKVTGSVVAITTRSCLWGASRPVTTSGAHQSCDEPSRKVRVTFTKASRLLGTLPSGRLRGLLERADRQIADATRRGKG
jgi:hypothetical protein